MFRSIAVSILLFLALVPTARADALAEALDAHQRGDEKIAIELLLPLAEAGDVTAMNTLSHIYWWGDGVTSDHAEALQWTRRAAARGSARGQHDLALHYAKGDGVVQDFAIAAGLYKLAADQGEPRSQTSLGSMKLTGMGISIDEEAGLELLRRAAEQGYSGAQQKLGVMSWKGLHGFPQDPVEAARLLELAAEQRDVVSQVILGLIYQGESRAVRDQSRAARWLALGASGGCQYAAVLLVGLRRTMPPDEYQAAIKWAGEWERSHPVDRHAHTNPLPDYCRTSGNA